MRYPKVIFTVALFSGFAAAQHGRDVVAELQGPLWRQPISSRVRLTAQGGSETFKPGDPVKVNLTLKNLPTGPMGYSIEAGRPELSYLLLVYREDGIAAPRVPLGKGPFGRSGSVWSRTLDRGEEVTETLDIGKVFDLTRKGKYYVRVGQVVHTRKAGATNELAVSDVVTFVVAE